MENLNKRQQQLVMNSLCESVELGNIKEVQEAIEEGNDFTTAHKGETYAIEFAVLSGMPEMVELLLDNCQPQQMDAQEFIALMHTCVHDKPEIAEHLFQRQINIHAVVDLDEFSPLMAAAKNNNPEMVKLLVKKGVNIDATDFNGWSALMFAANENAIDTVKVLFDLGANVDLITKDTGANALAIATEGQQQAVISFLENKRLLGVVAETPALATDTPVANQRRARI